MVWALKSVIVRGQLASLRALVIIDVTAARHLLCGTVEQPLSMDTLASIESLRSVVSQKLMGSANKIV